MKHKLLSAILVASAMLVAVSSDAASFGRSSGGFSSPSRSFYSAPAPSRPSVAPSSPGGIGGTSGSMGVRKSAVTAPVAAQVQAARPVPVAPRPTTTPGVVPSAPTYGNAPVPSYSQPYGGGSPFMSSLGGSFLGSWLGSSMGSRNNAPVVVNSGGGYAAPTEVGGVSAVAPQAVPKSYGIGDFIIDVLLFAILIALLVGLGLLFYKGMKMMKAYVARERGIGPAQPFNPTAQFWLVQKAFAEGDAVMLKSLLGPDLVDEGTRNLEKSELTLSKVSHEVVLNNPREFSVHYKFNDDLVVVDQVWHYEKFDNVWKLNGIETV